MNNSIYLQVQGVTGECKDSQHEGWLDIKSFQWQLRQPTEAGRGGGGGSGRLAVRDLEVIARMDKAMPTLMAMGAEGKPLATVNLVICKAGGKKEEYLKIILTTVTLSSVELFEFTGDAHAEVGDSAAIAAGDIAVRYCFSPSLVEVGYHEQDEQGNPGPEVSFSWNVKSNCQ
jgi:type VI secretion system secreted protein Hcp